MELTVEYLKERFCEGKTLSLDEIIKKAYRDMQPRTITGHTPAVQKACTEYLKKEFAKILDDARKGKKIADFEKTHGELCDGFLAVMNDPAYGIKKQEYGKAQKVVNIIFKFLAAQGECLNEDDCHVPIDSYILKWLTGKEKYNGTAWSYLKQEDYKDIQEKLQKNVGAPVTIGAKKRACKNRMELDYFIWYTEKVKSNYKGAKNTIHKLCNELHQSDVECIPEEFAAQVIAQAEMLIRELKNLTWPAKQEEA